MRNGSHYEHWLTIRPTRISRATWGAGLLTTYSTIHLHAYDMHIISTLLHYWNISIERNSTLYSFHSYEKPFTNWGTIRRIRHATYALWHVTRRRIRHATRRRIRHATRRRIRHATNYNASIALFKSLGLFFVASKDLSRLLLPLIWQRRPPHSLIFKKIIIITNIPTNINNFRYFIITIYTLR